MLCRERDWWSVGGGKLVRRCVVRGTGPALPGGSLAPLSQEWKPEGGAIINWTAILYFLMECGGEGPSPWARQSQLVPPPGRTEPASWSSAGATLFPAPAVAPLSCTTQQQLPLLQVRASLLKVATTHTCDVMMLTNRLPPLYLIYNLKI